MQLKYRCATVCFYLVIAALAFFGFRYLFASQIMPYHQVAMGSSWEALAPGVRIMSLNFMKSAGTGFLTTALAALFIMLIPYRQKQGWAKWALVSILCNELILIMIRVIEVRRTTPANPPFILFIILISLVILGFMLSFDAKKNTNIEKKS